MTLQTLAQTALGPLYLAPRFARHSPGMTVINSAQTLRRSDRVEVLNVRTARHGGADLRPGGFEMVRLAVRLERTLVLIDLHHDVGVLFLARLEHLIELVAGLVGAHLGREVAEHRLEL